MKNQLRLLKVVIPLLVLALGLGGFSYLKASRPESPKPKPKEKIWQVEVFKAEPEALAPVLTLYGELETQVLLQAAAPGAGLVTEVMVQEGDIVTRDQPLVKLDQRDFELAVDQARADVLDLEAQLTDFDLRHRANLASLKQEQQLLKLAQSGVAREERMRKKNLSAESALDEAHSALGRQELSLISRQTEVDRYQATRKQFEARLLRNQARLAEAELALERSQVFAPFDGIIISTPVAVGDRVQIASVLVTLYPTQKLEVRARIPTRYQAGIQNALADGEQLTATAELAGHPIKLALIRLAGEADPSGIDAYFSILEGADRLRLGNLLKLNLQLPLQQQVVSIPFQSIYGNNRIYLLKDGRMQGIDVESVGQHEPFEGASTLLVRSPEIQSGDLIVRTHLPNAASGLKVEEVKQ